MPAPSAEKFDSLNQGLNKLLAEHQAASYELPLLKPNVSSFESWLKLLGKWLNDQLGLDKMFGTPQIDFDSIKSFLSYLLVAALITLVVSTVWLVIKNRLRRNIIGIDTDRAQRGVTPPGNFISDQISLALHVGDIARACRWRWQLFLQVQNHSLATTPFEFLCDEQDKTTLTAVYPVMFAGKNTTKDEYDTFHQGLIKLAEKLKI